MLNKPYNQLGNSYSEIRPGLQFLIFTGIFILILIVANIIGAGIILAVYGLKTVTALSNLNTAAPNFINALWILQTAGTTVPIFATPLIFAYLIVRDPQDYIKPNFHFPQILFFLVFAIMFAASPMIEFLSNLNQKMVLPPFLKWMRESEDNADKITETMLNMKSIRDMLGNVLLIGLVPAIVEEFMFRGCLQTIFTRWTKNTHAAIWITAILFSAFHIEFFGFLPRLFLGLLFGYFVAWSGSIWTGVWAHFINNGTAVVVTYFYQKKITKLNPDDQHVFNYTGYLFSFIIILFLLFIFHRIAINKTQTPEY